MTKELQRLMNKVNKVTAYHRHGRTVPNRHLTELANAQLDYEEAEREVDVDDGEITTELNRLAEKLKWIRNGDFKVRTVVKRVGDLTTVEFVEE